MTPLSPFTNSYTSVLTINLIVINHITSIRLFVRSIFAFFRKGTTIFNTTIIRIFYASEEDQIFYKLETNLRLFENIGMDNNFVYKLNNYKNIISELRIVRTDNSIICRNYLLKCSLKDC